MASITLMKTSSTVTSSKENSPLTTVISIENIPMLSLPDKQSRDRRARVAVATAILLIAVLMVAVIVPAAIFMINGPGTESYIIDIPMRREVETVLLRLQPVKGNMSPIDKKAFEFSFSDFVIETLPDIVNANVEVISQSLLQLGGSVENDDAIYSNMALVKVDVQKSAYSRIHLKSNDIVDAVSDGSSLLKVMLKSKIEAYFETLSQVIATSTSKGVEGSPESEKPKIRGPVDPLACNGLLNLCDMPVNEIMYATSHNANSDLATARLDANHLFGILDALKAGVRGLNIDIGKCNVRGVKKLSLIHSR